MKLTEHLGHKFIHKAFETSEMYSFILNLCQKAQARASLWCCAWYPLLVKIPIWTTTTWRNGDTASHLQSFQAAQKHEAFQTSDNCFMLTLVKRWRTLTHGYSNNVGCQDLNIKRVQNDKVVSKEWDALVNWGNMFFINVFKCFTCHILQFGHFLCQFSGTMFEPFPCYTCLNIGTMHPIFAVMDFNKMSVSYYISSSLRHHHNVDLPSQ